MSSEPLVLRTLVEADVDQAIDLDEVTFAGEPTPAEVRAIHRDILEIDRSVGVFDGDTLAGVGLMCSFEMTVPGGGQLPLAGIGLIAVLPTYRRRGVMRSMIRHQLFGLHETGREAVAGLTASEAAIYGRFGYGVATLGASFAIPRHRAGLRPVAGAEEVRLRLVPTAESLATCEEIHSRQVSKRPGMMERPEAWGRAYAADVDQWREGRSALRTVLAERDGRAVGFARYRTKNEASPSGIAIGWVDVEEVFADDTASFAALAGYLLDLDLTASTRFERQAVDVPLVHLLTDLRAAEMRVRDGLYLRLVDVDRALAGRTYSTPIDVVLDVTDELCPWNSGRWRLTGDEKTAQCVRTDAAPDLALDVRELASAYLGGTTLVALAQAALVTELRPGALTDASRAFSTDLAPWLQFGI
jgi:predicted acetyltransferase